jgi:uncharacterized protein with PIN domain
MTKFLVDTMLGKLAMELRMLGFDTLYYRGQNGPIDPTGLAARTADSDPEHKADSKNERRPHRSNH